MTVRILGIALAFSTSLFWTLSPMFFSAAGRRMGSFHVNVIRLSLAAILLCAIAAAYAAAIAHWTLLFSIPVSGLVWLALSGISGLVAGDAFYLEALTLLGPRRTTQLFTLTPITSALIAWLFIGERLSWPVLGGIALIVCGIAYATAGESSRREAPSREPGRFSIRGLAFAAVAALFQAIGAVLARQAFTAAPGADPILATVVRVGSAAVVIGAVGCFTRSIPETFRRFRLPGAGLPVILGTLAGPVLGMLLYVSSFKYAPVGIVSALSSLSPILILPVVAFRYKTRISRPAIFGTCAAVAGMAMISL